MIEQELIGLVEKIRKFQAEFQMIEVKAANGGCPQRLYDTLSSFSNQDEGGILVFGLDEKADFNSVGVYDVQDIQKSVNEQCKQMNPIVRPVFTSVEYDNKFIVSAEIPGIDVSERPCFYSGVGRIKGSYVRSGDSDEPMSEYEVYSYEAYRKKYQNDIRVNERALENVIDKAKMEDYVQRIMDSNPKLAQIDKSSVYELLSLTSGGKYTLTSIMLFSIYPQLFYPQYTVNATVIPGYERGDTDGAGARFTDNKRIEGTVNEMLEGTMRFLSKNMSVKTIIKTDTGERVDKTEYPIIALREAVLNALIHRDYSIHTEGMPIEVIMFKDRIEIHSPGGLYGRLTVDKLGVAQPDTRNPVLARTMETLGKIENRYSGIPTIRRELKKAGLEEPIFNDSRHEFCVIFYNREMINIGNTSFGEERKDLVEFCKTPRTREEIAEYVGMKTIYYVVKNCINPLIQEGKLKMTIPDRPKSKNQRYFS